MANAEYCCMLSAYCEGIAVIGGKESDVKCAIGRERRKSAAEKIVVRVDLEDEYGSCIFGVWNIGCELRF